MATFNALDTHGYVLAILEAADETDADLYRLREMQPACTRVVAVAETGGASARDTALTEAKAKLAESLGRLDAVGGRPNTAQRQRTPAEISAEQPGLRGALARLSLATGSTFTEAGLDAGVQGRQRGAPMQPRTIQVPHQAPRLLAGTRASVGGGGTTLSERSPRRSAGLGRMIELREGGKVVGWQVPAGHRS